jgi:hypothetical protein
MSRTGIHGGIRRGAAAAAIGAVLVLTTGVQASQSAEGTADPGDPAAPAVDTQSLPVVATLKGKSGAAHENAPGQNRDGDAKGKAPAGNGQESNAQPGTGASPAATPSASASAVPSALRPAVTATQKPAATPAPSPTDPASQGPAASGPASSTPAATRPAASAPARSATGSAPGSTPASSAPASGASSAPAPVAAPASPAAGSPAAPETPPGGEGTAARPASPASAVPGDLPVTRKHQSDAGAVARVNAVTGTAAAGSEAAYVPIYSMPQAESGWTPYATQGGSVRSSATLSAQPEPKSALVWLGSGLVGVAGAAGLVLFRLRNP